jgi:hypothetical protein
VLAALLAKCWSFAVQRIRAAMLLSPARFILFRKEKEHDGIGRSLIGKVARGGSLTNFPLFNPQNRTSRDAHTGRKEQRWHNLAADPNARSVEGSTGRSKSGSSNHIACRGVLNKNEPAPLTPLALNAAVLALAVLLRGNGRLTAYHQRKFIANFKKGSGHGTVGRSHARSVCAVLTC